jgi:hypothetical protein
MAKGFNVERTQLFPSPILSQIKPSSSTPPPIILNSLLTPVSLDAGRIESSRPPISVNWWTTLSTLSTFSTLSTSSTRKPENLLLRIKIN